MFSFLVITHFDLTTKIVEFFVLKIRQDFQADIHDIHFVLRKTLFKYLIEKTRQNAAVFHFLSFVFK